MTSFAAVIIYLYPTANGTAHCLRKRNSGFMVRLVGSVLG